MWVYGGTVKNAVVSSGASVVAENGAFENVKLADYGYMSMGYAATATGTVLSATPRAADPSAKLVYNDYNAYNPSKRDGIAKLAKELKKKGLIDAVGKYNIYVSIEG